ncbi:DUF2382 domain-containing protein [Motilibacter deserti]|uniref:DUF2382 domain-containing protein n=1 Tax=Motilibacter deserti TaxID=2714956 RepID=A0ABX0GZQ6_9ACTN|nr:DUF2382 domain-containing protein [Motilibacter deserti]NHC15151.1 DUF2382 domain-containing protein [Motilibacter deserti]
MITQEQAGSMLGGTLYGSDGGKIGKIGQVFVDDMTGRPEWATVHTGLFGTHESFVPLAEADLQGGDVHVPFDKTTVKDAPSVDPQEGHLSEDQEAELYRYYGMPRSDATSEGMTGGTAGGMTGGMAGIGAGARDDAAAGVGSDRDTSFQGYSGVAADEDMTRDDMARGDMTRTDMAATDSAMSGSAMSGSAMSDSAMSGSAMSGAGRAGATDDAMTRSEERLRADTETVSTGRARLRKWVETEQQQVTVPVTEEKARLVSEPVTDENYDRATSGPAISEAEHEVTLHAERPVVSTETVPVERVRLETEAETHEETVTGDVRKERIDLDAGREADVTTRGGMSGTDPDASRRL